MNSLPELSDLARLGSGGWGASDGGSLFLTLFIASCNLSLSATYWRRIYKLKSGFTQGGSAKIWFGQGCATQAPKPLPIFKGHLGRKRYPLLKIFLEKQAHFSQILQFS